MFSHSIKKISLNKKFLAKVFAVLVMFTILTLIPPTAFALAPTTAAGATSQTNPNPPISLSKNDSATTQWGGDPSQFSRTDNVTTNIYYDASKYAAGEASVGSYSNGGFSSDSRIVYFIPKGGTSEINGSTNIAAAFMVDSSGNATRINSYQNGNVDLGSISNLGQLNGIIAQEKNDSLMTAGVDPNSSEAQAAKDQAAKTNNSTINDTKAQAKGSVCDVFGGSWKTAGIDFACLVAWLAYTVLKIISVLVWAAGGLLDLAFKQTILNFAINMKSVEGVITSAWTIIRDLMNIGFIFALLYSAICTVLRIEKGNYKKIVPVVIIAAIFVNFSLFFTKVIIDFSNATTVAIYSEIKGSQNNNIAAGIMQSLHLEENLISTQAISRDGLTSILLTSVLTGILLIVIAFVFFVIAILFIVRFLVFIFLMITSPVAIGGNALPKLKEVVAKDWLHKLTDQAIWAPVFFLMFSIAMQVQAGLNKVFQTGAGTTGLQSSGVASAAATGNSYSSTLLTFTITIGLIIMSLVTAKKMSASGAGAMQGWAMKFSGANALQAWGQKIPGRTLTRATNATAGRVANAATGSAWGQRFGSTRLGNGIFNAVNAAGASRRSAIDERSKKEVARAELRTSAANLANQQTLDRQRQVQADANILQANERLNARTAGANNVQAAQTTLTTTGIVDQTGANVMLRDLEHAQEVRTAINEEVQNIDRDIANSRAQLQSIQATIQASGGVATAAQQAAITNINTAMAARQNDRNTQQGRLTNLNALVTPLQTATRDLDRIDTELGRLYANYDRNAPAASAAAINQLATEIRQNGDESIRHLVGPALATERRALNTQISALQAEIRNTQTIQARQNANTHITGGIIPGTPAGFGLNQAAREAAAREFRNRYTGQNAGNR